MHALRLGVALLMFVLAVGQEARAGIYNLDEPKLRYFLSPPYREGTSPAPWKLIRDWRADLARVDDRYNPRNQPKKPDEANNQEQAQPLPKSPLRLAYEKQAEDLEKRLKDGRLTLSERVSLGGCLLRLGRWPQAMTVLEDGLRTIPEDEPTRFLRLLNLAAAYRESDDLLQRAIDTQTEALRTWPDKPPQWLGWNQAAWEWYRWAERHTLDLMRLRLREVGRPGSTPDALFPKVRFTGPTGKYEAGSIAIDQWNELPRDAEQLVTQLMIWQPHDPRLYWLYGELLNARGEVPGAHAVLDNVFRFGGGGGWPELGRHRRVLLEAQEGLKEKAKKSEGNDVVAPPPPPPAEYRLPDWRTLSIGFLVGVVVTVLAGLQLREWRRRRSVAGVPALPAGWEGADLPRSVPAPAPDSPEAAGITRPEKG